MQVHENINLPEELRQLASTSWFIDNVSVMLGLSAAEIESLRKRLDIETSKARIAEFNGQEKFKQVEDAHSILGSDDMASLIKYVENNMPSLQFRGLVEKIHSYWTVYGNSFNESPPFG